MASALMILISECLFTHLHRMCTAAMHWLNEGPYEYIYMQEHRECLEPNEVTINICPKDGLTV